MTTNQEYQKVKKRLFGVILPKVCRLRPEIDIGGAQQAQLLTDEILSDPILSKLLEIYEKAGGDIDRIYIKAKDQSLPEIPRTDIIHIIAERDRILLEAHWVKVEPKEEG